MFKCGHHGTRGTSFGFLNEEHCGSSLLWWLNLVLLIGHFYKLVDIEWLDTLFNADNACLFKR